MSFGQFKSSLQSLISFLVHICSSGLYRGLGIFHREPYMFVGSLHFAILLVYNQFWPCDKLNHTPDKNKSPKGVTVLGY